MLGLEVHGAGAPRTLRTRIAAELLALTAADRP